MKAALIELDTGVVSVCLFLLKRVEKDKGVCNCIPGESNNECN